MPISSNTEVVGIPPGEELKKTTFSMELGQRIGLKEETVTETELLKGILKWRCPGQAQSDKGEL
jgi:hypothetical protein